MDRRKRYKTYLVDHLKSVPHITIHRWKKAKNRASCQNLDQNNASDQSNEEQINQNEFQSERDESFSGFSSYYSRGTSVDCELEGGVGKHWNMGHQRIMGRLWEVMMKTIHSSITIKTMINGNRLYSLVVN